MFAPKKIFKESEEVKVFNRHEHEPVIRFLSGIVG
jgi:hypothetical protein